MSARTARVARWTVRVLVGFALLLALAAALLWWWAGREGSLQWVLQRVGQSAPLQSEGVQGSLRGGWHIQRLVWDRDGIRVEAQDIRLEWQPLAILNKTLQLDLVQVARVRVTDTRPRNDQPLKEPAQLKLPWRVAVDSLKVGAIDYSGRTQLQAAGLAAGYAFDGLRHRLDLQSLHVAGGDYRGKATLLAVAPLTLDAQLSGSFVAPVPGSKRQLPLELALQAQGPARAIEAKARLSVPDAQGGGSTTPRADATARITPFADMPVPRAEVTVQQVDAAMFWPAAPRTLLSGHAQVVPLDKGAYRVQADLRNAAAGPWDEKRLPVATLRVAGEWRDGTALVESLRAQAGGGSVEGSGRWQGRGWAFKGDVKGVDPAQLHTSLAPLPLTGPLQLSGEGQAVRFDVALNAGASRARGSKGVLGTAGALELREIAAKGTWSGDLLSLASLQLRTSDAMLQGEGEWQPHAQAGRGKLQLQAPGLQLRADGSVAETKGQGSADLGVSDLAQAQRWLARWPGAGSALAGLALQGQAQAHVAWQGGWRDPAVQVRATASSFAWQPSGGDKAPLPWVVRDASATLQGRLRDAALELRAQADQGQRRVELTASGRVGATLGTPMQWHGRVASLTAQFHDPGITPGAWRLVLSRPVDWHLAGGAFDVAAGEAVLHAPSLPSGAAATDAVLAWGPVRRQGGQLTTSGHVSGLPLAWIELAGVSQLGGAALSGDMVFDAQWDAQLGTNLRLNASLVRVRGDVNVLADAAAGAATRVSAGVRDARVSVSTQGGQLELRLLWDSERAGHAEGVVRSRLVRDADGGWSWPAQAPLSGRVQAQLPSIGVWSVLAPPGWRLRGSLTADIQVAGTRAQPELSGPIKADDLALRSVVDGIEMRNGRLRAQLHGRTLVVEEFLLHGSSDAGGDGGTLLAQGEGSLTPEGPVLRAQATLSLLRASVRSDRQLTVSGTVAARVDRTGTEVTGDLRVDRARIQIPDESPPRLREDVVVHNAPGVAETEAERRQRPAAGSKPAKVKLRVDFDLGPDFRVKGRGVDTRLAGKVEIRNGSAGLPEIFGVVRTEGGTYQAYGQRMNIERGVLRFTGPADNPALDILAVRPNMVEKVGVQVTGRAQSPHVELYSDTAMTEAEKLSYVVLGRSSAGSGAETALLQRAAGALLAGRSGTGKGIAGSLGLDDISVSGDGTSGAVVRVGKRFANNFYAAYERSLSGAMGTLFIFYDISRRITVRGEAGERTGLDLIFTFTFDKPKGK